MKTMLRFCALSAALFMTFPLAAQIKGPPQDIYFVPPPDLWAGPPPPPQLDWRRTPRDWGSIDWEAAEALTNATGTVVGKQVHHIIELADGLNYLDWTGQWRESEDLVEVTTNGAAAVRGPTKVHFGPNINAEGAVTMATRSNNVVHLRPIGLYYFDAQSGDAVQLASVQDCQGQVLPPNQVVYDAAFGTISADILYTWKKGAFESDVILHESPKPPSAYNLNNQTTRLELWHVFGLNDPLPQRRAAVIEAETNAVLRASMAEPDWIDEQLDYGDLWLPRGYAFALGGSSSQITNAVKVDPSLKGVPRSGRVAVGKHMVQIGNRVGLVESVPWREISQQLQNLPAAQHASLTSPGGQRSKGRRLPVLKQAATRPPQPMKLAGRPRTLEGFCLDYITVTPITNYTFAAKTTYFISSPVTLNGTVTCNAGSVIKYFDVFPISITVGGTVVCNGTSGSPTILTSMDENIFGDVISGSTGNPLADYSDPDIWLYNNPANQTLSNMRIRWAGLGIYGDVSGGGGNITYTLDNIAFEYCVQSVQALYDTIVLQNCTECDLLDPISGLSGIVGSLTASCEQTLGKAVEEPGWPFSTWGNAGWFYETSTSYSGGSAVQSGPITDSQNSYLQATINGPGTLSFYWQVSSETNYDCLRFYLDGAAQAVISGQVGWTNLSYGISSGTHTLEWAYTKDASISQGSDAGWVDLVQFQPGSVSMPGITAQPQSQTVQENSSAQFSVSVAGTPPFGYQWYQNGSLLPGANGSAYTISSVQPANSGNYYVAVSNAGGTVNSTSASLTVEIPDISLGQAVDNTSLSWPTGGYADWFGENTTFYSGGSAAQSGPIGDNQSSFLRTSVTGPGGLGFYWKVSSEPNCDFLMFTIDGAQQAAISGGVDWTPQSYLIPSGTHTLQWTYSKDPSISEGADAGWVDLVQWQPGALWPPTITAQPQSLAVSQNCPAQFTVSATGADPSYQWYHSGTAISGATATAYNLSSAQPNNAGAYYVVVTNAAGGATSACATLTVNIPLVLALDNSSLSWTTGGNANWFGQTNFNHYGGSAAQSGPISDSQNTWMQTTVTGPGTLTFYWQVSSEEYYDVLAFSIGGVQQAAISGQTGWTPASCFISSGAHAIQWIYSKDPNGSRGADAGWVDLVQFQTNSTYPTVTVQPVSQGVELGGNVTFTVAATGTPPLSYQWRKNGTNIANATATAYSIIGVQLTDAAYYSAVISNAVGWASTSSASLTTGAAQPAGMVSWWQGQYNCNDFCGLNNGQAGGELTYIGGEVGVAFCFNGDSDVFVPASSSLDVGAGGGFTLECWIYPQVTTWLPELIAEWYPLYGGSGPDGVNFSISAPSPAGTGQGCLFGNVADTSGVSHYVASPAGVITNNVWYHVAFTYDKGSGVTVLYLNGSAVAQGTFPNLRPQTTYGLCVGGANVYFGASDWNGTIDELTLYNRALCSSEIQSIYSAGSQGKCTWSCAPPTVYITPSSEGTSPGGSAPFYAIQTGERPFTFQWYLNGLPIVGACSSIYSASVPGIYTVSVSNSFGEAFSAGAPLTLTLPPTVTEQPSSQSLAPGANASLSVAAGGYGNYQWTCNGTNIPGAIASTLNLINAQAGAAGNYSVVISNYYGSVTSAAANLSVGPFDVWIGQPANNVNGP